LSQTLTEEPLLPPLSDQRLRYNNTPRILRTVSGATTTTQVAIRNHLDVDQFDWKDWKEEVTARAKRGNDFPLATLGTKLQSDCATKSATVKLRTPPDICSR
jgi:hypothetical protein